MAENECLDLLRSPAWRRVADRIAAGAPDDEVSELFVRTMYRTLQRVERQIPLRDMLRAACMGRALADFAASRQHEYAKFVWFVVCEGDTLSESTKKFIGSLFDRFLDQIGTHLTPAYDPDVFVGRSKAWRFAVERPFQRLADTLSADATRKIRAPARRRAMRERSEQALESLSLVRTSPSQVRRP